MHWPPDGSAVNASYFARDSREKFSAKSRFRTTRAIRSGRCSWETSRKLSESNGQPGHQGYSARLGKVTTTGEASSLGTAVLPFG